jgi:hypothetical protein
VVRGLRLADDVVGEAPVSIRVWRRIAGLSPDVPPRKRSSGFIISSTVQVNSDVSAVFAAAVIVQRTWIRAGTRWNR